LQAQNYAPPKKTKFEPGAENKLNLERTLIIFLAGIGHNS
jgi:hypothetical protein